MSNLPPPPSPEPTLDRLTAREASIGPGFLVRRALPRVGRRTVGAWCFADHMGPVPLATTGPLRVAPHPHTGLYTATWMIQGEILHKDSLGTVEVVRGGELNLMIAGEGISHSEESHGDSGLLEGVQLWIALPAGSREIEPSFEHHSELPRVEREEVVWTVFVGEAFGVRSEATTFSRLVGVEGNARQRGGQRLALEPGFEHAILVVSGELSLEGEKLRPSALHYLGMGREEIELEHAEGTRFLLLGGEPFEDPLYMWWNFVGADRASIERAREDWEAGRRFGEVLAYTGEREPAPPLR